MFGGATGRARLPPVPPAPDSGTLPLSEIVAQSAPMRALLDRVARVAPTSATLLLIGDSGTGKEVLSRAVHGASSRADAPFVAINCGALAESVIESVLFGHKRGAFTGADRTQIGVFESAQGGTLFLDEVGELTPNLQVRLLRVLQEGRILPVGETRERPVDVRIVAATNKDLGKLVREGRFREDLFYRLNVVTLRLPPLSERGPDLPALTRQLLERANRKHGRTIRLDDDGLRLIAEQPWPGNVRELAHFLEQVVIFADGERVGRGELKTRLSELVRASGPGHQIPAPVAAEETLTAASTLHAVAGTVRAIAWWRFSPEEAGQGARYVRPLATLAAYDQIEALPAQGAVRIGRDETRADFVLATAEISRLHATVTVTPEEVTIQDQGSHNGSFVAGAALPPGASRPLIDDTPVRLGKEWVGLVVEIGCAEEERRALERLATELADTFETTRIEVKAWERAVALRGRFEPAGFLAAGDVLCLGEAPAPAVQKRPRDLTKQDLLAAFARANGNRRQVARDLGISPGSLYKCERELRIWED